MSACRLALALALVAASTCTGIAATADAAMPPVPINLRVLGGAEAWHPDNDLRLDWEELPRESIAAVHLRVRNEAGQPVIAQRIPQDPFSIDHIHVPGPGRYLAEIWFEGDQGEQGPAASATFRFDDVRPGATRPLLPAGWVGAGQEPLLRLAHPEQPPPISGIRGYAVVVGLAAGAAPCRLPDRCAASETDLSGGVGDDAMALQGLPEGTVHVSAVAVSGSGKASATIGEAILRVDLTPPAVRVASVPQGWVDHAVRVDAVATDAWSGMDGGSTSVAVDGAAPAAASGSDVSVGVGGEGSHLVTAFARDAAGNLGVAAPALVRIDRGAPRVAFAPPDPADPELLRAAVVDDLSGVDPARGSIGVRPRRSHRQFAPLPTAIVDGQLLAHWDSDRYPPGYYELQATGFDRAGNVGRSGLRSDGAQMVLPAPLKAPARLLAGFGGPRLVWHRCAGENLRRRCRREAIKAFDRRPRSRVIPYGRPVTVGGLLLAPSGAPLGSQRVEITEVLGRGAGQARRTRELATGADGSFLARLSPGPSRRVEFAFAGTRTLAAATAAPVSLGIRGGVRMRASSDRAVVGGPPLVFSGAVEDAGTIPAGGKSVQLQFRLPDLPWSEFRTLRTDGAGHFRYRYRFSDDDSRGVRFQFRAFAPAEGEWPYEPAASRPLFVLGQ